MVPSIVSFGFWGLIPRGPVKRNPELGATGAAARPP
jgi:hypothetical protein